MANRKILYGYQIIHGDLVIQEEERLTVQNIFTTYLAGLSYQASTKSSECWKTLAMPGEMDTHPLLTKIPSSKCRKRSQKRQVGSFHAGRNRMAYGKSCEADAVRLACSEPEGQSGIPETSI